VTLADLAPGRWGTVHSLRAQGILRQRLLDLGLVPGTPVQLQFVDRGGTLAAYYVRGAVLALRRSTAEQVLVSPQGELL
jgi:ferrous iron transport protein A